MVGRHRWCWRRRRRGRPPIPRSLEVLPEARYFIPSDIPAGEELIELTPDELEALRLVYLLELTQEEAARRMGISKTTLWRLVESGRKKLVEAIVTGKSIRLVSKVE